MNSRKILCVILLGSSAICFAQDNVFKIAPIGETRVSARLGKSKIEAIFRTSTIEISSKGEKRFVQCTYSRFPCSLTEQIRVVLDDQEVFIPVSAYSNLGDVTTAKLTTDKNLFVLTIKGGDASEAYIAKLVFGRKRLLERRLYSGEDPYHPLEVSRYYEVSTED